MINISLPPDVILPLRYEVPTTPNVATGLLVPTPTFPFLSTMNEVPVVEPITNAFCPDRALIDSLANGEVVENPTEPVNWLVFENVLKSASSVDEAAPDSDVKNPASLLNHDNFTEDEAIVCVRPFDPVNTKPCDSDGRYSDEENVDDAVENSPLNPITVDVEL